MSSGFVTHPDATARLAMLLNDQRRVSVPTADQAAATSSPSPVAASRDERTLPATFSKRGSKS